ncbi:MAG TPA: hypothetical protein VFO85_02520 [Vicinamibacteria bacterium]|nr:hypothetical protein [Vicinamibacteria bacterium]
MSPPPQGAGSSTPAVPATDSLRHLPLPQWLSDLLHSECSPEDPSENVSRLDPADEEAFRQMTEEPVSVAWWTNVSKEEWQQRAMAAAGIDPARWDPSDGFKANEENIKKVYALYAQWYLAHPELKWAGMAKLAGGSVYGGLLSLQEQRPGWSPRDILVPFLIYDKGKQVQMDKVERIFVEMQKNIFMDMAWQHQAYAEGGLSALAAAYNRGDMSAANFEAWSKIASGDPGAQWEGNKTLLMREQSEILPPDYERIRDLWGGGTIAENISENTVSPIPGGAPFQKLHPHGDVTDFEDRWKWIEDQMLPEYKALGDDYTRTLVNQPLDQLARREFAPDPRRAP